MAYLIGIDIGKRFVKVIEVEKKNRLRLVNTFKFPTPYKAGPAAKIDGHKFCEEFKGSISAGNFKSAWISVNIPSSQVSAMVMELPRMSGRELETAVTTQARRMIVPTPGPNSVFQHSRIRTVNKGKALFSEVLVVKAEKPYIEEVINLFGHLGDIYPLMISPACYTLPGLFPRTEDVNRKKVAFIDIGYESIDISITEKGILSFYRTINSGLKDIMARMSGELNLPGDKVEEVIIDRGVPRVEIDIGDRVKVAEEIMRQKYESMGERAKGNDVSDLELRMLWENEFERIVQEVRRTFVYYNKQRNDRVEKVFFLGGGSAISGLVESISEKIGGEGEPLNPFGSFDQASLEGMAGKKDLLLFAPAASVAVSLPVMRSRKDSIDFLPLEFKKREAIRKKQIGTVLFIISAIGFVSLAWLNVFITNTILTRSLKELDTELSSRASLIEARSRLREKKALIDKKVSEVNKIREGSLDVTGVMGSLGQLTPDGVFITSLDLLPKEAADKGKGLGAGSAGVKSGGNGSTGFNIVIEASCDTDYERAVELSQRFEKNLRMRDDVFFNVVLYPPELEAMTPMVRDTGSVKLTESGLRFFNLEAEVKVK